VIFSETVEKGSAFERFFTDISFLSFLSILNFEEVKFLAILSII